MIGLPFLKESLSKRKGIRLDDVVDRLNYIFTSILLLLFANIVGAKQFFGRPISCMTDAEFPGQWADHAHEFCFTNTTYYYLPSNDPAVPDQKVDVPYFQWAPFVLALQALLFCFPHFLWISLEKSADLDLRSTVERVANTRGLTNEQRDDLVQADVKYLIDVVEFRRSRGASGLGRWCTVAYLGCKLLSAANIVMQIGLLEFLLGDGHRSWALTILQSATDGTYWPETNLFARVTYCDFELHTLGNRQKKTAQCALTINILNEKVFVVVYLWLAFLLLPTVLSLAYSVATVAAPFFRLWFVRRYMEKFVVQVLGMDGVLLLRFVQAHAGHLMASKVARELFKQWQEHHVNDDHCIDTCPEFVGAEQSLLVKDDQGCPTA